MPCPSVHYLRVRTRTLLISIQSNINKLLGLLTYIPNHVKCKQILSRIQLLRGAIKVVINNTYTKLNMHTYPVWVMCIKYLWKKEYDVSKELRYVFLNHISLITNKTLSLLKHYDTTNNTGLNYFESDKEFIDNAIQKANGNTLVLGKITIIITTMYKNMLDKCFNYELERATEYLPKLINPIKTKGLRLMIKGFTNRAFTRDEITLDVLRSIIDGFNR